jgi:hypothetical protein
MSSRRGSLLLVAKAMYIGGYMILGHQVVETFVLLQPNIKPNRNFGYVFRSPFGGDGCICK